MTNQQEKLLESIIKSKELPRMEKDSGPRNSRGGPSSRGNNT